MAHQDGIPLATLSVSEDKVVIGEVTRFAKSWSKKSIPPLTFRKADGEKVK